MGPIGHRELIDSLSPEAELLVCCARPHVDTEAAARIRALLRGKLDWPALHRLAYCNGQFATLAKHLGQFAEDWVPAGTMRILRDLAAGQLKRNHTRLKTMLELHDRFASRGIEAWPFLESYFSLAAYGGLDKRPCHWLNFLIRPDSLTAAREVMRQSDGWREAAWSNADETGITKNGALFFDGPQGVSLSLHWAVAPWIHAMRLDLQDVLRRPTPVSFQGHMMTSLSPEDAFLHACVRSSQDLWVTLSEVCDVGQILHSHPALNWDEVLDRGHRSGTSRMLLLGTQLAHALLGCMLPDDVLKRVRAHHVSENLAREVTKNVLMSAAGTNSTPQTLRFHLRVRDRAPDRLRYLWRFLITPTQADRDMFRMPVRLRFLRVLFRPLRLIASTIRYLLDSPMRKLFPRPRNISGYSPSNMAVVQRMLVLAEVGPADVVYDLGCGDGRIVIEAAKRFGARGVGFDLDPVRIRESLENARHAGVEGRVTFHLQDAMSADLSAATVVTLYLPPKATLQLASRLMQELPAGARIVSHNIALGEWDTVEACESDGLPALIYVHRVGSQQAESTHLRGGHAPGNPPHARRP